jgi:hypothetical protein
MRILRVLFAAALLGHVPLASAGNGTIDFAGDTVNFTMNLRFPATAAQMATLQNRITDMSHLMWDATEGQLRVGTVTFTCSEATLDVADYWVFVNPIRSNSSVGTHLGVVGVDTGTLGVHINMAFDREGQVFFHELGHLAFNLGDEYPEKQTQCGGKGPCFDAGTATEQNHCIMQQNVSRSEFCVSTNHDPIRGNNVPCALNPPDANGAPCATRCEHWNTTTMRFEASSQHMRHGESCWETLRDEFPQLTMPAGLPATAEPGGWSAPAFVVNCTGTSTFVLVLDDSGSMAWSVKDDFGEVCDNGTDDDLDGTVDETDDCAESRMEFVQAAGRAILELAEDPDVKAGIVRFDSTASAAQPIQPIAGNLATLRDAVDDLDPGTQTAIGLALNEAKVLLDADPATVDAKAAFIITDGHSNTGPSPESAAAAYEAAGIRIYAIATGQASNSDTISDITANSAGFAQNEQEGDELVTAVGELFAQYRNGGIIVPQTPYALMRGGNDDRRQLVPRIGMPMDPRTGARFLPNENTISFPIEEGTRRFSALLGGNLGEMSGFGVDASLRAPDGTIIDSSAPPPGVKVVLDPYFTLVRIPNPLAGTWTLTIRARPGAAPAQTGTLAVISDNPRMHLFADVDREMVTAPGQTVNLTVESSYISGLRDVSMTVAMRAPDGSVTPVAIAAIDPDSPHTYTAALSGFPMRGRYELLIDMRTTPATTNDPGEQHPDDPPLPPLSVPIPPIQRSLTRSFFVDFGPWICPEGRDCDGDGITDEPVTVDTNGNGIPAAYDPDDDGNNVPDRRPQGGGTGTNNPFDGSRRRWWFGGAVGSSHPLGSLDRISDANIYAKLDAALVWTPTLNARLALGLAQFTTRPLLDFPHPRYAHVSANAQLHGPLGVASRWFVNGGPGLYRDQDGSTSAGGNVGLGVMIPLSSNVLELGADYHRVSDDRGSFVTWHLGVLFH